MAGFIIGSTLMLLSIWDRHIGNNSSSDIELCCGLICYTIQYGVNAIIDKLGKDNS